MPPDTLINWEYRSADLRPKVPFQKQFIFVCEGANTEFWYFSELKNNKDALGVNPMINVDCLERGDDEIGYSDPRHLIEQADAIVSNASYNFNIETDFIVFVFDLDKICRDVRKEKIYCEIFETIHTKEYKFLLGLTNPNFELFLLLHKENSFNDIIQGNEIKLLAKKRRKKKHLSEELFSKTFGMSPKTNPEVGKLVMDVQHAIRQEFEYMNQDLTPIIPLEHLTSTVGKCIQEIMNNTPTNIHGGPAPATTSATP